MSNHAINPATGGVCWPVGSPVQAADFEWLDLLGDGRVGKVFRARHRATNRQVAIKVYSQYLSAFDNEVFILEGINHPHLPRLLTYWEEQTAGYMVMELIDGPDLAQGLWPRSEQLPAVLEVIVGAAQVAAGLAYLHAFANPVIHRDVKPGNMVRASAGRVVLVDFDGAVLAEDDEFEMFGTIGYCAPEQAEGQPTLRSDIYAFGISLWELLTGTRPDPLERFFPSLPETCPANLQAFLRSMLALSENLRPDAAACLAYFLSLTARSCAAN